jgi:hypothetical protein
LPNVQRDSEHAQIIKKIVTRLEANAAERQLAAHTAIIID